MAKTIISEGKTTSEAIEKGADITQILNMDIRENIARTKYIKEKRYKT